MKDKIYVKEIKDFSYYYHRIADNKFRFTYSGDYYDPDYPGCAEIEKVDDVYIYRQIFFSRNSDIANRTESLYDMRIDEDLPTEHWDDELRTSDITSLQRRLEDFLWCYFEDK
jgi:hypothetical protein